MARMLLNQNGRGWRWRFVRGPASAVLLLGVLAAASRATVTTIGDVRPFDLIATPLIDEGIPPGGHGFNASEPLTEQTGWEENEDIIVGQSSFGRMDIDGSSQLRYEDLIIGDMGMLPNGQERKGTGFVLINGIDALYSNDPNIVPPSLIGIQGDSDYFRPRDEGFDLYVGRDGVGTLQILAGGRADIQDLTIVADDVGSTGNLLIDGFASYLGTGGFEPLGGPVGAARQMIIGRQGVGAMTISNGGTVVADSVFSGAADMDTIGAVIGGDAFANQEPQPGGRGTVHVLGPSSQWIIGGSLQIGGFHELAGGPLATPAGELAQYNSEVGRGTLRVVDGALVSLRPAIDADPEDDALRVVIGRFGRLELTDGYVNIGDPGTRHDNIALVNDGVIIGSGRIDTGRFINRYFGEIRISAGQKLLVDATSEFLTIVDEEPLFNFGRIEVFGTTDARAEIEFDRAPDAPLDPIRPFINRTIAHIPGRFDGGLISAQHATLRFRSGIINEGSMVFSEGMNIMSGRVDNITGANRNGLIYIAPNTTVVSEDDFATGGLAPDAIPGGVPILTVAGGGTLIVENAKSLTVAGLLELEMSFTNPSRIQVAGDLGVNATLLLSFASDAITSLSHGDAFELMSFSGDIGGVDFTDPLRLIPDLAANPVLNVVTDAAFNMQFPNFDLIATPILQSFYLFVLDPSMVGPPAGPGAMGADFNGDGVVDGADLAIWLANVGITIGASVLQGDADGDGDVDGDDFLKWQRNVGPCPVAGCMGSGAGSGSSAGSSANVPEPSAMLLLVSGGLLGLANRRRRVA